jgi:hypothetical protein
MKIYVLSYGESDDSSVSIHDPEVYKSIGAVDSAVEEIVKDARERFSDAVVYDDTIAKPYSRNVQVRSCENVLQDGEYVMEINVKEFDV